MQLIDIDYRLCSQFIQNKIVSHLIFSCTWRSKFDWFESEACLLTPHTVGQISNKFDLIDNLKKTKSFQFWSRTKKYFFFNDKNISQCSMRINHVLIKEHATKTNMLRERASYFHTTQVKKSQKAKAEYEGISNRHISERRPLLKAYQIKAYCTWKFC